MPSICEQMSRQPLSDAMPELVEMALRSAGAKSDNVTVLCVEWESAEDGDAKSGVSTQNLGDEVFASTIQASLQGDAPPDELDDAEIERSIREINEAIQRSVAAQDLTPRSACGAAAAARLARRDSNFSASRTQMTDFNAPTAAPTMPCAPSR